MLVGNLKERDHLEDLGVDERLLLWELEKQEERAQSGILWLKTGENFGLLTTR